MKTRLLALSAAAILCVATAAQAADNKICLSGVCIGATLAEIPTDIKWISEPPRPRVTKKSGFDLPDFEAKLARQLQADPAVIKELETYRSFTGDIKSINARVIAALKKIRGTCSYFELNGEFKSESGHRTTVTIKSYPSADGSSQQIRVSQLMRYYDEVRTREEIDRLADQLQAQFEFPVQTGSSHRNARLPRDDEPRVNLNNLFGGATTLVITESNNEMNATRGNAQAYRRLHGCAQPTKVD
jgi:hypothetical protein